MFDDGMGGALGTGAGEAALVGETALGERATGAVGAGIMFGIGSISGRGALAGEAEYDTGESIVLFLGNSISSSLSLFFPWFNPGDCSVASFCPLGELGED